MSTVKVKLLRKITEEILAADNTKSIADIVTKYVNLPEVSCDSDMLEILNNLRYLAMHNLERSTLCSDSIQQRIAELSDAEKMELDEVIKILDNNQFNYYFQPIVNTIDGEIYSFEALMRPKSDLCKSPLLILKYAELTDRLADIEKATFMNILKIIEDNNAKIGSRYIFINSIPKVRLNGMDFGAILPALLKFSRNIVIELTEQTEMSDNDLSYIKLYNCIGIQLAIDDYGTGYSNVQNLIRYTPNYVKIDRVLINGVDTDLKKQHFVREIIEFCHDNNCMALAEGVETQEELHTVIALGADLIQGFYTAKPCGNLIETIPENIRAEIKRYRAERDWDKAVGIYRAIGVDRIRLDRFKDFGYSCILVKGNANSKELSSIMLTGCPDNPVTLAVEDYFVGEIILDNTALHSNSNSPCISIGNNCKVSIILVGINKLSHGGICVPESSELAIAGDGVLNISIDGDCFYGIGNDRTSRHGKLKFEQGVVIDNNSVSGVCIGSGLGGVIEITHGKFDLVQQGEEGVAIGSLYGPSVLDIDACDMQIELKEQKGIAIGSFDNSSSLSIVHSDICIKLSGDNVLGFGTYEGETCSVKVKEASVAVDMNAHTCSAVASIAGETMLILEKAHMQVMAEGTNSYAIGCIKSLPILEIRDAHFSANIITEQHANGFRNDKLIITRGTVDIKINDQEFLTETN